MGRFQAALHRGLFPDGLHKYLDSLDAQHFYQSAGGNGVAALAAGGPGESADGDGAFAADVVNGFGDLRLHADDAVGVGGLHFAIEVLFGQGTHRQKAQNADHDEQSDLKSFLDFIESQNMEALDRGDNAYEVVQNGYSKATACEFMLDRLNMTKEQAYVFGDSSNDLAMFEFAIHAVAMGDHDPVLDPYTEYVTKTVEEDGIAWALKHYDLI